MSHGTSDPFGLLDPAYHQDPYSTLARIRAEAPVHYCEPFRGWMITRHEDVTELFRDDRLSANRAGAYVGSLPPEAQRSLSPLVENFSRWALMKDPPDHTRLRGLVAKAFTPTIVAALEPGIEAVCDRLLDDLERSGRFDIVDGYAAPAPVQVIGRMLGLGDEHTPGLRAWSRAFADFLGASQLTPEVTTRCRDAVVEMEAALRAEVERRRRAPGEDLLSALLAAQEEGHRLDEAELLATCTMLLFAGHETTTHVIGNSVRLLLEHPAQLAWLRDDLEGRMPAAIEELMRCDGPAMRTGRIALEPIEVGGHTVARGDRVYLMMASANRDPSRFERPDQLDLQRSDHRHFAFGHGRHYCLGAALGRVEAQIALTRLLRRFPGLRLAEGQEPRWIPNYTLRGLRGLDVETQDLTGSR